MISVVCQAANTEAPRSTVIARSIGPIDLGVEVGGIVPLRSQTAELDGIGDDGHRRLTGFKTELQRLVPHPSTAARSTRSAPCADRRRCCRAASLMESRPLRTSHEMQPTGIEWRSGHAQSPTRSSMCVETSNTLTISAVSTLVSSMWNLMRSRSPLGLKRRDVIADCQDDLEPPGHGVGEVGFHRVAHCGLRHCQVVVFNRIVDGVIPQAELAAEVQIDLEKVGDELRDAPTVRLDDCAAVAPAPAPT